MRSLVRAMFALSLMLSVVSMAGAADEAKAKGKKKDAAVGGQQVFQLPKEITLTEEQQTKLEALKKEHSPKLAELAKKLDEGITDEQKKARRDAIGKAKAEATVAGPDLPVKYVVFGKTWGWKNKETGIVFLHDLPEKEKAAAEKAFADGKLVYEAKPKNEK